MTQNLNLKWERKTVCPLSIWRELDILYRFVKVEMVEDCASLEVYKESPTIYKR
jgi:hypothetical protein